MIRLLPVLLFAGCASTSLPPTIDSLAKDPATACIVAGGGMGSGVSVVIARSNGPAGSTVEASPNGGCKVTRTQGANAP